MRERIKVLATDDHTLFRKGFVLLLESFPEIDRVLEASNGQEALQVIEREHIDIILLDLDMPVLDGYETAKKIVASHEHVQIIILSMNDSLDIISQMIEIGAHSYLLKSAEPDEVHKAILSVLNNDFYYNQIVAKALHRRVQNPIPDPPREVVNDLTRREKEILELICEELTMKEIGDKLFLSEQTVQTHRKNLMKKTRVKNGVGLVKYAIQHRVIEL